MFIKNDISHPLLMKVLEKIEKTEVINELKRQANCGTIYVFILYDGVTLEYYNGGYRATYREQELFSTHSGDYTNTTTLALTKAIDAKLKANRTNAVKEFLAS